MANKLSSYEPEQRVVLRVFVDDGAVFQVTEVEHPDRAVRSHRRKHVPAAARSAEGDVVHLRCAQTARCKYKRRRRRSRGPGEPTLLLYSSTKLPSARRNRLSGRTLQFMAYTVHGASYL
ncbi:hypothetical protein EYF80_043052 [Liparis tanakae]|uniref:Uncharacterized protein n=1 Tax=Liparis tanakae TaxID=230148 RepID=A0A4Z2FZU5_9TELE|nr:hypothetical protein EYF80_043052 [Liparis tanakae]